MPSTSQILTIGTVAVVLGVASYAIYFDYARRNDAQFRKKLRKEKKRVDRSNASIKASTPAPSASGVPLPSDAEIEEALQIVRSETLPTTASEKEQYFMSNLAVGEQLASQGLVLPAALSFFRAIRVYPEPLQLVMILEKTLPEDMFRVVMDLMSRDVKHKADAYHDHFPPKKMNVKVEVSKIGEKEKSPLQRVILVATKDFKAGDTIFTERPMVTTLDVDLMGTGQYCSHCLKAIPKGSAIQVPLDPFHSAYCSAQCQHDADEQYQKLLFSTVPPATPSNPEPVRTKAQVEERKKAQEQFVETIKESGRTGALLVLRFVGRLIADEHARLLGDNSVDDGLPKVEDNSKLNYSFYDYTERLRSLVLTSGPQDDKELAQSREVLRLAVDGMEAFLDDERFMLLKGKMAYNCYGVTYDTGRTNKPQPKGPIELLERTRTPQGTMHQVGSALYRVASYINHSCTPTARPVFETGTAELTIKAVHDIKSGEEITVSYVDTRKRSKDKNLADARKHRRLELARGWGFACDCARCAEEAKAMSSDGSENGEALPTHQVRMDPAVERYFNEANA